MADAVDVGVEEDETEGRPGQPMSTAQRRAAGSATAANYATNTAEQPNFFQEAGNFLFGTGTDPGLFGTGQYRAGDVSLPGAGDMRGQIGAGQQEVAGRTAPTLDQTQANQFREQQMALAGDLLAASRGQGPSVAQEQLRQGTQANLAASVAAANSVRGPGAAAGAGQLLAGRANTGQQMAGQAALLRAEEVTQARGQLGGVLGQGRGQDLQGAEANLQAQQELQRQKDAMTQYYLSLGFDISRAEQAAQLEVERLNQASYYQTAANRGQIVNNTIGAVGTALGVPAGGKP